jgi:hypothetical protein
MMKSSVSSNAPVAIPPLVVAYAIGRGQKRPQPYERSMAAEGTAHGQAVTLEKDFIKLEDLAKSS